MRKTVAVVAMASIVVAACSNNNETVSTGPATAAAPPATVAQPTSTTEAATTTTTSTTVAPSTTISDEDRFRAAEQAFVESWEAYHAAILDPANPELRAEIERTSTLEALEVAVEVLDRYVEDGVAAKPHPSIPAEVSVISDVLFVPGEQDLVDLIACEINSESYYEIGTAPDGSDALIRDEVFAVRSLVRMVWDGESWRLHSGRTLSESVEVVECSE